MNRPLLCTLSLVLTLLGVGSLGEAQDQPKSKKQPPREKPEKRAVLDEEMQRLTDELKILSEALKSLDQSYSFRGMRGDGAFTAGSIFIDWQSKDVAPPEGVLIHPPTARRFGESSANPVTIDSATAAVSEQSFPRGSSALSGMPPRLIRIQEQELRPDFELSFCIDLAEHATSDSHPVVWLGENPDTSPLIVDQYHGELRLRFTTDVTDKFGTRRHEVNLGSFCAARCYEICYAPARLVVRIDGHSFVITAIPGRFVADGVEPDRLHENRDFWQERLRAVSWKCVR